MTAEQLTGLLRALAPILVGVLVRYGMDDATAGLIVASVLAAASAVWSWYSNRPVALAKQITKEPGVEVVVAPTAAPALKELAADPTAPGVIPKP